MRLIVLFLIAHLFALPLFAQQDTSASYKAVQARLHYGFIFAHSEAVQNTAGAHPRGIEIDRVKQRTDTTAWDLCHCYPVKGWSLSYFDFNVRILGYGLTAAYFIEPAYRIGRKGQFRFRAGAGLSYLTNPYDSLSNPTNMSYSSHISGFLQLGVSGTYLVAPQLMVQLGAQYQHVSNGGLKEPNKGINWPTASAGLVFFKQPYHLPVYRGRYERGNVQWKPYLEAGLFFSAKQGYQAGGQTRRTLLTGLLIQAEKQVGRTSALNGGIEFYYDNALNQQLRKDSAKGSAYRVGLLAGHDFLLGRFFFSQQLGVYLYHHTPYYTRLYHRWALRYRLNKHWMPGFALNAHRHVADFFDLRLMYRF